MRTALLALALVAGCTGPDTDTDDTDYPDVCRFLTNADTFTFGDTAVGDAITGTLQLEMQCPEPVELTLSWEDPQPTAFRIEGETTRTLPPWETVDLEITFAPPAAGAYESRMQLIPADPRAGGIIARFRGNGI